MPYIKPEARVEIMEQGVYPRTPGELNFMITMLIQGYIKTVHDAEAPNYAKLNEIIGVLECCKLEFYRRIVAEFEEDKMEENGDVYS